MHHECFDQQRNRREVIKIVKEYQIKTKRQSYSSTVMLLVFNFPCNGYYFSVLIFGKNLSGFEITPIYDY